MQLIRKSEKSFVSVLGFRAKKDTLLRGQRALDDRTRCDKLQTLQIKVQSLLSDGVSNFLIRVISIIHIFVASPNKNNAERLCTFL